MKQFKLKVSWKIGQKKHSVSVSVRIGSSSEQPKDYYDEEESEHIQAHNKFWQEKSFGNYTSAYLDAIQKEMEAMSGVSPIAKGSSFHEEDTNKFSHSLVGLSQVLQTDYTSAIQAQLYGTPHKDTFDALGYTWVKYSPTPKNETSDKWIRERLEEMGFQIEDPITPEQWLEAYRKLTK